MALGLLYALEALHHIQCLLIDVITNVKAMKQASSAKRTERILPASSRLPFSCITMQCFWRLEIGWSMGSWAVGDEDG